MAPIELKSRREALGLSQSRLADLLDVKQNTVAQWESGVRGIPFGVSQELDAIEDRVEQVIDNAAEVIASAEASGIPLVLFAYGDDAALWAAIPELAGLPAVCHRIAMARARVLADAPIGITSK